MIEIPADGTKNLIPQSQRTKEEQKIIASKGGVASGAARRKKRDQKKLYQTILDMKPHLGFLTLEQQKTVKGLGFDPANITDNEELLAIMTFARSLNNTETQKYMDELMGRNPQLLIRMGELRLKEAQAKAQERDDSEMVKNVSDLLITVRKVAGEEHVDPDKPDQTI